MGKYSVADLAWITGRGEGGGGLGKIIYWLKKGMAKTMLNSYSFEGVMVHPVPL